MTSSERDRRVEELFHDALARPPSERAAHLDEACGDDEDLRREVDELLAAHDAMEGQLETPAAEAYAGLLDESSDDDWIGREVGGYTIRRIIGSGGMGTVFAAEQRIPRRTVALKLMRSGMPSQQMQRRFRFEVEVLGRLHHSGIAQVFEAGVHEEGSLRIPYFALEYVPDAQTIVDFARARRLTLTERLELFAQVCDAVHYGHQRGVIHRDLKPGNILVDPAGRPKVIDFGVARATDPNGTLATVETERGALVGTLQYMSPEQTAADPHDIDTRSDVYALGVVLYELLCNAPPYDLAEAGLAEGLRIVREQAPRRPSTHESKLRGDVDNIVLKALAKDRAQRYVSAAALGRDVQRFLQHEPVEARPPTIGYHLRLLARRNRGAFALAVVLLLVLVGAVVVSASFAWEASNEREVAVAARREMEAQRDEAQRAQAAESSERRKAEEITELLMDAWGAITPERAQGRDASLLRDVLDRAAQRATEGLIDDPEVEAVIRRLVARVYYLLRLPHLAEEHARRALELYREHFGVTHTDTLRVEMNLSALLTGMRRFDEAEELARDVLEIQQRLYGDDHPATLGAVRDLGVLTMERGRPAEAVPLLERAAAFRRERFGDTDRSVIIVEIDLASALARSGSLAEAERLHEDIRRRADEVLGPEHPDALRALHDYAAVLLDQLRPAEAAPILEDVVQRTVRLFGEDALNTMRARDTLVRTYMLLDRFGEAGALLPDVVRLKEHYLGPDDESTLMSVDDLVMALFELGQRELAVRWAEELVQRAKRTYGEGSPTFLMIGERMAPVLGPADADP